MTKALLLSLDLGTTSTRAIVFNLEGEIIAKAQKELQLIYPQSGWVEQDPKALWQDAVHVINAVLADPQVDRSLLKSIGITNQRETIVLWDSRTGQAYYNAIVWQDRRTAPMCVDLKQKGFAKAIEIKTGLLLDPYFSATKIKWLLEYLKLSAEQIAFLKIGTVDSFVMWHLTKGRVHATDATNASRTMLFNIVQQDWDDDLCTLFNVPKNALPMVHDCVHQYGRVDETLVHHPLMIEAVIGDQQAALCGQGCFSVGDVKATYGTGCFILMNIGERVQYSKNQMLTTVAYRLNGKVTYALEGAIFIAGAAVQWLRDGLKLFKAASDTTDLQKSITSTNGVYMVPSFTGLGAPYWQAEARGAIIGLNRDTGIAEIVRAALEAQGYQTRDLLEAMAQDSGTAFKSLKVDGGMVSNDFVCQFLANMTAVEVMRPHIIESTARGAAMLAGYGAGFYEDITALKSALKIERVFTPMLDENERTRLYAGWKKAVDAVMKAI